MFKLYNLTTKSQLFWSEKEIGLLNYSDTITCKIIIV